MMRNFVASHASNITYTEKPQTADMRWHISHFAENTLTDDCHMLRSNDIVILRYCDVVMLR